MKEDQIDNNVKTSFDCNDDEVKIGNKVVAVGEVLFHAGNGIYDRIIKILILIRKKSGIRKQPRMALKVFYKTVKL